MKAKLVDGSGTRYMMRTCSFPFPWPGRWPDRHWIDRRRFFVDELCVKAFAVFKGTKPLEFDVALIHYGAFLNFFPLVCCLRGCSSGATKDAARASAWAIGQTPDWAMRLHEMQNGILGSNISSQDRPHRS